MSPAWPATGRADQLRAPAGELTLSGQRERRRLARLLPDHLQQLLVGCKSLLTVLSRHEDSPVNHPRAPRKLVDLLRHLIRSVALGIYYGIYQLDWRYAVKTARLFVNGRSQAVRLPKDCRFRGSDVYVKKFQGLVILFSKENPWAPLLQSLDHFSDDFMSNRDQPPEQKRPEL